MAAPGRQLSPFETLLAVLVAVVWGLSFVAIKLGVADVPPFMLSGLRFLAAAVPAVFFVRPPRARAWIVVLYGLLIGVAQFGLLFTAIRLGMPAGLSSLVIQAQVFFTVFLSALAFGERPTRAELAGAALAMLGIVLIGVGRARGADVLPFVLVVVAALTWGCGNVVGKLAGRIDMLAFTIWSSLAAPLPLFALSFAFEGRAAIDAVLHPTPNAVGAVVMLAYGATMFGFGIWSWLLSRHPAAAVAPFALLVPVVGLVSAAVVFGEPVVAAELVGAALVMAGLAVNIFGVRLSRRDVVDAGLQP